MAPARWKRRYAAFWLAVLALAWAAWWQAWRLAGQPLGAGTVALRVGLALAPWAVLLPAVLAVAQRWPLTSAHRARAAVANGVAVVAVVAVDSALRLLARDAPPGVLGPDAPFVLRLLIVVPGAVLLAVGAAAAAHSVVWLRLVRGREHEQVLLARRLSETALQTLRARLHPELVFGALAAVGRLVAADARAAGRLLADLGDLLRTLLDQSNTAAVPVGDELATAGRVLRVLGATRGVRYTLADEVPADVRGVRVRNAVQALVLDAALAAPAAPGSTVAVHVSLVRSAGAPGGMLQVRAERAPAVDPGDASPAGGEAEDVGPQSAPGAWAGGEHRSESTPAPRDAVVRAVAVDAIAVAGAGQETEPGEAAPVPIPASIPAEGRPGRGRRPLLRVFVAQWALVAAAQVGRDLLLSAYTGDTSAWDTLYSLLDTALWMAVNLAALGLAGTRPLAARPPWRMLPELAAATCAVVALHWAAVLGFQAAGMGFAPTLAVATYLTPRHFVIVLLFVAEGYALRYFSSYRAAEDRVNAGRAELARAQLHLFAMRLRPHFLLNAFHSAGALIRTDPPRAAPVLAELEALLRDTLDPAAPETVTLADELAALRRYLALEQVRYGPRLSVSIEADTGCMGVMVPRMLLQPLAENAIHHGVAPTSGAVRLQVRVRGEARRWVRIEVADTGAGLPPGWRAADARGFGLASVRRRMELLYGGRCSFEMRPAEGGGTRVVLRIPA